MVKREAISKKTLYREKVQPEMGGKVPESHYHREEFNKLDAQGLKEPLAMVMSERLKNKKLPEKMESTSYPESSITCKFSRFNIIRAIGSSEVSSSALKRFGKGCFSSS